MWTPCHPHQRAADYSHPAICRMVVCEIGAWEEIQAALSRNLAPISLRSAAPLGVLAFGRDADVKLTFEPHKITAFDTHAITPDRLVKPSGDCSSIADAGVKALGIGRVCAAERRGSNVLVFPNPASSNHPCSTSEIPRRIDYISGTVRGTGITWNEACSLRLDYRLDRPMAFDRAARRNDPIPEGTSEKDVDLSRDLVRERQGCCHNKAATTP